MGTLPQKTCSLSSGYDFRKLALFLAFWLQLLPGLIHQACVSHKAPLSHQRKLGLQRTQALVTKELRALAKLEKAVRAYITFALYKKNMRKSKHISSMLDSTQRNIDLGLPFRETLTQVYPSRDSNNIEVCGASTITRCCTKALFQQYVGIQHS